MITVADLKSNAQMRGVCFLDMGRKAYRNTFQSQTYPRLVVVKEGGPRIDKLQQHTTTYFVDDIECADLDAAVAMLNTAPHPKRTGMDRHQQGEDQ
jgi:hypothetical protein